jgi:membrane associated rhomboid family serine protease
MFPLRDDQPTYSKPVVCVLLIVLNAMVFLHEMQLDEYSRNYFIMRYGLVPDHLRLSSLITMQFIHAGWLHIIGNMIFLWAFGRSLEDAMGSLKFLIFYLLSGIAAALAQVLFSPGSNVPMVGASGAIAGVMGGYLIKFPRARIHTLVFIFIFITRMEIPALFFLPYWFLTQLFAGYGSVAYSHLTEGGVAYFAHIGGFVAGMALVSVLGTQDRYVRRRDIRW